MAKKLLTLAIFCCALQVAAIAQQNAQPPKTWAVVVGISKYQKLPGGQQLQFADRDAALISDAIQKRGVNPNNVKLLIGTEAGNPITAIGATIVLVGLALFSANVLMNVKPAAA